MNKKQIREYRIWKGMKSRCYSPSNQNMGKYQQDNIQVCDEWLHSYDNFINDMGFAPSDKHTLDRIDSTKDYSVDNCRWATMSEQNKNKPSWNRLFTYKGETKVAKDWAKIFNIKYVTLLHRLNKGLSFEQSIQSDPYDVFVNIKGINKRVFEWCKEYNIPKSTVYTRIHRGWNPIDAITIPKQ